MKDCLVCGHENSDDARTCSNCGSELDPAVRSQKTVLDEDRPVSFSPASLISERYRIVRELGRGGMGVVYLVKDTGLRDRLTALKMIHPELVSHEEARQRFKDEVILCLDLFHPHIVRINNLEESDRLLYFTMEYLQGQSLRQMMDARKDRRPPFSLEETIQVIGQVLDALSYAHQTTIHRDIKPENILVQGEFPDIQVKILDFGIAKILSASRFTRTAQSMGTAYYMSPEQMQGAKHIDHRSDLYAVGMILYEMLTGEIAAGRFDLPGELVSGLPECIDRVVEKVLSTKPEKRHDSAGNLKSELDDCLAQKARQKTQEQQAAKKQAAEKARAAEQAKQAEARAAAERARKAEKEQAEQKARQAEIREQAEQQQKAEKEKQRQQDPQKTTPDPGTSEPSKSSPKPPEKKEEPPKSGSGGNKWIWIIGVILALVVLVAVLQDRTPEPPARKQVTQTQPEKKEPPPAAPARATLYVTTQPSNATIRILNIVPKFRQGITLDPGKHTLEISAQGYDTRKIEKYLGPGEHRLTYSLTKTAQTSKSCCAYTAPGVWKEFDCYNLAAIGKTTKDDPFTPSWRLIGGYWQWGRKGPSSSQWHNTNTWNFAHGPTGSGSDSANSGEISGWDGSHAPDGAWSDSRKTANDPCPSGFRVPTNKQWDGVVKNNRQRTVGSWSDSTNNYSSAHFFGDKLMLPAAGRRYYYSGALNYRGYYGYYWSSSESSGDYAWYLVFYSGSAYSYISYRRYGFSVRCVAE
jgi:uncharacterized protein (TIGR02145 family)